MGSLHFHRRDTNADGLHRHVLLWEPYNLVETLAALMARAEQPRYRAGWLSTLVRDLEHALLDSHRPADEILFRFHERTNWDAYLAQQGGGRRVAHRIRIQCHVTKPGNLTVRFSPEYLDDAGRWIHADEWRDMPYLGVAAIAERPDDEVLFIHGVEHLLYWPSSLHDHASKDGTLELAMQAVVDVFWLTLHRLTRSFDVFVDDYVAILQKPGEDVPLGLEVVNATDDLRDTVRLEVEEFEADAGCSADVLWRTWSEAETGRGRTAEAVSKKLRDKTGPTNDLTPGAAANLHQKLERAIRYGLWRPPSSPSRIVSPVTPPGTGKGDAAPTRTYTTPRVIAFPGRPMMVRRAGSRDYSHLRSIALPAEVRTEFGVQSGHQLVDLVNAELIALGRKELAEGDFPSNRGTLRRLVKMLRDLRQRGP